MYRVQEFEDRTHKLRIPFSIERTMCYVQEAWGGQRGECEEDRKQHC